ncbi:hypothetical protein VPHK460_0144 [Vibrio phage K460]
MNLIIMKLQDFTSYAKLQEFIAHLESIPSIVNFVVVGNAILLEYEPQNNSIVYYYDSLAYVKNDPIIALGRDCEASRTVTDWDLEQLELKRMINGQGWV